MEKYWASLPSDEIGDEILSRVDSYQQHLIESGRIELWRTSHEMYYTAALNGARIQKTGANGEYYSLEVNQFRNLLLHLKTLTLQQRPAFDPRASNNDHKSQAQTILARSLLDYYLREKRLETNIKQAVEHALVLGEGFIRAKWDAAAGEEYGTNPETGAIVRNGDLEYTNFNPLQVVRDVTKDRADNHDWYILITQQNKWDLAAQYPEYADRIIHDTETHNPRFNLKASSRNSEQMDLITVYEFYHAPTPALPNGRILSIVCEDIVLEDGPLPYRSLPIYRIAPEEQFGSIFGYSVAFDLIPIQEAMKIMYSTVLTNNATFGVQNIATPIGSNLSVSSVSSGMNIIEFDPKAGPPQPLNLTQSSPEVYSFIQMLNQVGELISGINSVTRGNPESNLKSGSALALVQSMAIQFSMNLQQSYAQLLEDLGTATINILRDFATVPRIATIAGVANRNLMQQFTGDDLAQINRVIVDMGSALTSTTAGKVQLAETLLQNGMVKNPQEYIMVMQTGRLDPVIEGTQAQLLNIKNENEDLSNGIQVPVMITDPHLEHINEHAAVLASPEARRNPELIRTVTEHMMEHIRILSDPNNAVLLQLLGQTPQQAPQALGQAPGMLDSTQPVMRAAENVRMPSGPTNPLTGEQVDVQLPNV